jgi:integrase
MARRAVDYSLHSKTARAKLDARRKAYYRQIAPNVCLGYYRRESGPGAWEIRETVGGKYRHRIIGAADDVGRADGAAVLTFAQAQERATRPAPTAQAENSKLTVRQAVAAYIKLLAARSKHSKDAEQRAAKHILPVLGDVLVARLTKQQIEQWLAGMVRDDPKDADAKRRSQDTANRTLTVLKAALNATGLDDRAWRRVKAFRAVDAPRPDHFTSAEICTLVGAAERFDAAFARLLEVGYLTGARLGELVNANVGDFAAARGTLNVNGKTGKRAVTLTDECTATLRKITRNRLPDAPLLPKGDGARWGKSEQHRPMKRALVAAELPASASFYALRHSHISHAILSGVPLPVIATNTGTSLRMLEKNYFHVMQTTHRALIEQHAPSLRLVGVAQ